MDENLTERELEYKEENHTAFIVGYTGETGKELVKDLGRRQIFKKVYLLGRRTVDLGSEIGPEFVSYCMYSIRLQNTINCKYKSATR